MKLLFIRHGDPNYEIDSLTEKGWKEAELLAKRVSTWPKAEYFVSPLGRAQDTARVCLERLDITPAMLPWLKEFHYPVFHPEQNIKHGPWDFYPSYWTREKNYYDPEKWYKTDIMKEADIEGKTKAVQKSFDEFLETYGYKRKGGYYTTAHKKMDEDKDRILVFFCHFGITAILMAHMMNISPLVLLQNFFMPPSSLTILCSEERILGEAAFRTQVMGDTSHLLLGKEEVSPAGFFTSVFSL